MAYYIVGRDWPDQLYATNAKWPEACRWDWRPPGRDKGFRASADEMKKARELEEQALARREARKLKKRLFAAILEVRGSPHHLSRGRRLGTC